MKSHTTIPRILGAVGAAVLATALLAPSVAAHPGNGRHGPPASVHQKKHVKKHERRHVTRHDHRVYVRHDDRRPLRYGHDYRAIPAPRGRFTVPARISHRRDYDAYRYDNVWYAPHRHSHSVYYFPVRVDGRWIAQPHFYCGDRRFDSIHADFRGPRFSVHLSF